MNKLMVLKDVAYAAKTGGGAIASYNDADALVQGAIAFLNDKGTVITLGNAATSIPDSKTFTAIVGRAADTLIVPIIPRMGIKDVNRVNYRAATKVVHTIGGTSAGTTVPFTSTGEVNIIVADSSYTNKSFTRSVRVSAYKKATTTNEAFVDDIVAKLNAGSSFITATKVKDGGNQYFGITITPKENNVTLEISVSDMWESAPNSITTPMVHSIGTGADILQMEKDFSTEEGNSNFIDYTQEHYKRGFEAVASANYDLITLTWDGKHSSPSRSHNVMFNRLAIACINGITPETPPASNQSTTEILALLDLIVGAAYDAATGAEPVDDDGTDNDGVSGN